MLCLKLSSLDIKLHKKRGDVFYPDFIMYDFNKEDYHDFWQSIKPRPRKYLYSDGINIVHVGWWRMAMESFKGWLGFTNYCSPAIVDMTLAKVAYAGYLKGFNSNSLLHLEPSPISPRFKSLLQKPRTDQNSAKLQDLLVSHYRNNIEFFPVQNTSGHTHYRFGHVFINSSLCSLISMVDPQDEDTIQKAVSYILSTGGSPARTPYLLPNKFSKIYAYSLMQNTADYKEVNKIHEGLAWDPEVPLRAKDLFINFYFFTKTDTPAAVEKAIKLIDLQSNSPDVNEQQRAIVHFKKNIARAEQLKFLEPYPQLKTRVAKSYLADAQAEKDKWLFKKFLTGNNMLLFLAHAIKLDPQILEQDPSMQEILLREEWIQYQFNAAIEEQRFLDAENIYEDNPSIQFSKKHLKILLNHYLENFSANKIQIKIQLAHKEIGTITELTLKNLRIARKIAQIDPLQASTPSEAILNCAYVLLETDKIEHPLAKDANLKRLNLAQNYLSEYNLLNGTVHSQQIFNEILLRKIECLISNIDLPIGSYNWTGRTEFAKSHQKEIDALKRSLKDFIQLNTSNHTDPMRAQLARANYLLADVIDFFEEKHEEAAEIFAQVITLMPENPYYRAHYYLSIESNPKEYKKAYEEIGDNCITYEGYLKERWTAEKILSRGFDIHAVKPQPSGMLPQILKKIGFG